MSKYSIGPRKAVTIFGGYQTRDILGPDGNVIVTVSLPHTEGLLHLDTLIAALNYEASMAERYRKLREALE